RNASGGERGRSPDAYMDAERRRSPDRHARGRFRKPADGDPNRLELQRNGAGHEAERDLQMRAGQIPVRASQSERQAQDEKERAQDNRVLREPRRIVDDPAQLREVDKRVDERQDQDEAERDAAIAPSPKQWNNCEEQKE